MSPLEGIGGHTTSGNVSSGVGGANKRPTHSIGVGGGVSFSEMGVQSSNQATTHSIGTQGILLTCDSPGNFVVNSELVMMEVQWNLYIITDTLGFAICALLERFPLHVYGG